jgi:hypothetical protein
MIRTRAAAVCAAAVLAISTGTAGTASAGSLQWWQTTVFAIGPSDAYVAEWMGPSAGWTEIGGPASHLYVGSAGVFATSPSTGDLYQWNGTTPGSSGWTWISGPAEDFVQGGGHLYSLSTDQDYVSEYNGTPGDWTVIDGPSQGYYASIAAGGYGLVAATANGQDLSLYNGTPGSWRLIALPAVASDASFAVNDTSVYVETLNGVDEQWTGSGTNWNLISSSGLDTGANQLIAGGNSLYGIGGVSSPTNDDDFVKYTGTPGQWTTIGGPGAQFALSQNAVYGLGPKFNYVARYTPGVGWTEIGGPAWQIAADS